MVIDTNLSNPLPLNRPEARSIPQPSLRRLPQYHHYLVELEARGVSRVSCSVIGRDLGCIPVQVRKDLQYTGIIGKPKTGYSVSELIQAIETFLGWNNVNEAFLVGVGNLGTALLGTNASRSSACGSWLPSIPTRPKSANGFTKKQCCLSTSSPISPRE